MGKSWNFDISIMITFLPLVQLSCAQRHPVRAYSTLHAGEERGGVYSYSSDTVEGPRTPPVKLTARHSSLTRVRAAPLSPWRRSLCPLRSLVSPKPMLRPVALHVLVLDAVSSDSGPGPGANFGDGMNMLTSSWVPSAIHFLLSRAVLFLEPQRSPLPIKQSVHANE